MRSMQSRPSSHQETLAVLFGTVLAVAAVILIVATSGLTASAHPGHPQKKLFDNRWAMQVVDGDYGAWMTLTTSPTYLECGTSPTDCGSRWTAPVQAALDEWNTKPTTVRFQLMPNQSLDHHVNIFIVDSILGDPSILGLALVYDESGMEACDTCPYFFGETYMADPAHAGPYAVFDERRATVAHEIGHLLSLRHESVNTDESVQYPCGMDDTGPIPHSIMAYACVDPTTLDPPGLGETFIQDWDVCGVNHAYPDPNFGFAGCGGPVPSPTGGTIPPPTPPVPVTGDWSDVVYAGWNNLLWMGGDAVDIVKAMEALHVTGGGRLLAMWQFVAASQSWLRNLFIPGQAPNIQIPIVDFGDTFWLLIRS